MIDKILSPKFVLVAFGMTACVGFLLGKMTPELFTNGLMLVLGYFYGAKNGERSAKAEASGVPFEG